MPLRRLVSVLFVLSFCAAGLRAQQQLTLLATVVDREKGTPVETLTPADVHVLEDGAEASIVKVDTVVRIVKVQVLIDNGVGIGQNLSELRNGVRGLLEKLPPDVETTVVTTAPQGRFLVKPTKNHEELLKGIDRLAPDSSTGRFTESLTEAAERANKDKDTFTVIIAAGTRSGDREIREEHTKRLLTQIVGKPLIVHVLMYAGEKSATGGDTPVEVGEQVTKITGGRYEYINNMSRYATLLPEFGTDVAKQITGSTRQFRITAQRPNGKSGKFGKLSVSTGAGELKSVRVE
jgi:hypothetical protein